MNDDIQKELDRRKPGQSKVSTLRKEDDMVEILSTGSRLLLHLLLHRDFLQM